MARPEKNGIDYFPLDTDFFDDKAIRILVAKFGSDGIALLIYLYCDIYKNGYFRMVDEDYLDIVSADTKININTIGQVMSYLHRRSLIVAIKLPMSVNCLTSTAIQKRYMFAVKERVRKTGRPILVDRKLWLIPESDIPTVRVVNEEGNAMLIKVIQFSDSPRKNEVIPRKNDGYSTEKCLKEKKRKEKNNNAVSASGRSNKFNNFHQRDYDYDELEKQILDC